jgi:hypothetical protein
MSINTGDVRKARDCDLLLLAAERWLMAQGLIPPRPSRSKIAGSGPLTSGGEAAHAAEEEQVLDGRHTAEERWSADTRPISDAPAASPDDAFRRSHPPASGSSVLSTRISVDLPEPLAPMMPDPPRST